jgi:hypothetical protein
MGTMVVVIVVVAVVTVVTVVRWRGAVVWRK